MRLYQVDRKRHRYDVRSGARDRQVRASAALDRRRARRGGVRRAGSGGVRFRRRGRPGLRRAHRVEPREPDRPGAGDPGGRRQVHPAVRRQGQDRRRPTRTSSPSSSRRPPPPASCPTWSARCRWPRWRRWRQRPARHGGGEGRRRRARPRHVLAAGAGADHAGRQPARRAVGRLGAAAVLPQGPLRQGRPGRAATRSTRSAPRRRSSTPAAWPASRSRPCPTTRSPRRRSRTSRWATTASSSTTRRTSRSTPPQCVETFQLYGDLVRELLGAGRAGRRHHPGDLLLRQGGDGGLVVVPARRDGRPAQRRAADLPGVQGRPGLPRQEQRDRHRDLRPQRPAGAVRRDHQLGDRQDRRRHGERPQVHRVHDERGLHRLAGHRPRGQVPGAQGRQDHGRQVHHRLERPAGRRRHQEAARRGLPGRGDRGRCRTARTRSSAGASRRSRARSSAPRWASCPCPRRSARSPEASSTPPRQRSARPKDVRTIQKSLG